MTSAQCQQLAEDALRRCTTGRQESVFWWSHNGGETSWLVWLTPLKSEASTAAGYAVAICDPDRQAAVTPELLTSMYRLTKAEVRLALQMMQGRTPAEAARQMDVTIHTVRTYLKRLYLKVGVKTQATLVRKLLQTVPAPPPAAL